MMMLLVFGLHSIVNTSLDRQILKSKTSTNSERTKQFALFTISENYAHNMVYAEAFLIDNQEMKKEGRLIANRILHR